MKKLILSLAIVATALISCKENKKDKVEVKEEIKVTEVKAAINNVDTNNSIITWKGTKPGGAHNGTVALKSGSLVVENGNVTSGEFVIDMSSIKNIDMAGSERAGKIEGHLKSPDFFEVAVYPTAKFVITSSEIKDGKGNVTGNLTLKKTTKSITIPATVSEANGVVTFKSETFNVDRTDFGVTFKSKKIHAAIKDKFINDLMEMSFVVKTKK